MKRHIHPSTSVSEYKGFVLELGRKVIFLKDSSGILKEEDIRQFVEAMKKFQVRDSLIIDEILNDEFLYDDLRLRIVPATLQVVDSNIVCFYTIRGDDFVISFPECDFLSDVVVIESCR